MKQMKILLLLAAWLAGGLALDAGAPNDGWARSYKPRSETFRVGGQRQPRIRKPRAPRSYSYRSVTIRRPDGTVLRGYRDNFGTHLTGPDGKVLNCQRSRFSGKDIAVACH